MTDEKRYTEKTEVRTERKSRPGSSDSEQETEYRKETTTKTERKAENDKDEVIIIEE